MRPRRRGAGTGRDQLIAAGILTDVCVALVAMSGIARGNQVHAVLDASGTWNDLASQAAALRMQATGVTLNSSVAVSAELLHDWREQGDAETVGTLTGHALPFYGSLVSFVACRAQPTGV
ncbi:isochorismatase family protein [Pseudonocardia xishanensis]|uniref:Isochorismatase-like domain-containing protein n=1 Tax=Pseudonocardia xishanensis TaxID=630995 RepID=A0ABP8S2P7_9PSEU